MTRPNATQSSASRTRRLDHHMETTAAASGPVADLDASLHATRLDDPASPSKQQQHDPAPTMPRSPQPTLEEVRSRLLRRPMEPSLAMSRETSEHVVRLLKERGRGEEVRLSVLAGVKRAVHRIMGDREAQDVFVALVYACRERFDELQGIVQAVVASNDNGFHTRVAEQDDRAGALEQLCVAVRPYPSLYIPLVVWLLREHLLEQCDGILLAIHCFATMDYKDYSILIRIAIFNIDEMLSSAFGSRLLEECFFCAKGDELCALEEIILSRTSEFAKGLYSNYFLQRVLEDSYPPLSGDVVERVAADVASLAADRFGSCVVETCFLRTRSPAAALQRVLAAFLGLRDDQLAELVRGGYSSHVVRKLLATGKDRFTEETLALARRIKRLPAAVREEVHARQVMEVVESLLPYRSACTTHDDASKYLRSCM
ncbi:hypothetical protein ACP70R_016621 [Stipagrostis hirtigluma subsp. patula]